MNALTFKSEEEFNASVDNMCREIKEYASERSFLWIDDIGEILDRGLGTGTYITEAMNLYAQAKWILVDSKEDSD